jgi:ParB/RepB/Spo0J family partition protein
MPVTDQFQRLSCQSIRVLRDDRQRRAINTDGLRQSIEKNGVLQPIIVRQAPGTGGDGSGGDVVLVAGERRLQACLELGLESVPVRFLDSLSPVEIQIIELEENLHRADLDWQDQVAAVAGIHQLYCQLDPEWSMGETADRISLAVSTVSMYIRTWTEINSPGASERLASAGGIREAYNIIMRADQREQGNALQELLDDSPVEAGTCDLQLVLPEPTPGHYDPPAPNVTYLGPKPLPPPPEAILNDNFLLWAPQYTGRKFNLIHCDFPYGVQFNSGPQGQGAEPGPAYDDSPEVYWNLVEGLCANLDRIMSVSGHLMFWYSSRYHQRTIETFARLAPSIEFGTYPLVWLKSDNAGIASDPRRWPRHIYETCLFGARGKRQLVKMVADAYSAPTDKRLHISTKPEPMLRHFMQMVVDENTTLLDPTAGSGAALRAAESLGAKQVLGLEIDQQACEIARQALRNARALRQAVTA